MFLLKLDFASHTAQNSRHKVAKSSDTRLIVWRDQGSRVLYIYVHTHGRQFVTSYWTSSWSYGPRSSTNIINICSKVLVCLLSIRQIFIGHLLCARHFSRDCDFLVAYVVWSEGHGTSWSVKFLQALILSFIVPPTWRLNFVTRNIPSYGISQRNFILRFSFF